MTRRDQCHRRTDRSAHHLKHPEVRRRGCEPTRKGRTGVGRLERLADRSRRTVDELELSAWQWQEMAG